MTLYWRDIRSFLVLGLVLASVSAALILGIVSVFQKEMPTRQQEQVVSERKSLEQLAKEQGWEILYKDPEDTTGRTILTLGRGIYDGAGVFYDEEIPRYLVGRVSEIKKIVGSEDLRVSFEDPITGGEIPKIRIDRTKSSSANGEIHTTPVLVDNLLRQERVKFLGYAGEWDGGIFSKLVSPGDFLGVELALSRESTESGKIRVVEDDLGGWLPTSIVIRRIGGKEAILKELER